MYVGLLGLARLHHYLSNAIVNNGRRFRWCGMLATACPDVFQFPCVAVPFPNPNRNCWIYIACNFMTSRRYKHIVLWIYIWAFSICISNMICSIERFRSEMQHMVLRNSFILFHPTFLNRSSCPLHSEKLMVEWNRSLIYSQISYRFYWSLYEPFIWKQFSLADFGSKA